jgi:hypothetical protein
MEDHTGDPVDAASAVDCGVQGVEGTVDSEMVGDRPAQQTAAAGIGDPGEVQPALVGGVERHSY